MSPAQDALNEHYLRPGVDHGNREWFDRDGDRLIWTFNRTVAMGVLPVSRVVTGHTFAVQRLHEVPHPLMRLDIIGPAEMVAASVLSINARRTAPTLGSAPCVGTAANPTRPARVAQQGLTEALVNVA